MKEFRVTGPPGCGKTTWLKRQVKRAAEKYGASRVVVCSLTRSAASHVASAQDSINNNQIGTLHSMAFRGVNAGKIAEANLSEFNAYCDANGQPAMKLKSTDAPDSDTPRDDLMSPGGDAAPGDRDLNEMNKFRARMIDPKYWPESVRGFAGLWERWKGDAGVLDFTDLLVIALRDCAKCPGDPDALLFDESQDFSRLAWKLGRKWGEAALAFVHVGDPDQILYEWAGVDPGEFNATKLDPSRNLILKKSYRVPKAVHALAVGWINQTRNRKPIAYEPRDFAGVVRRDCLATIKNPSAAIHDAKRYLDAGKSVMFCATCSYMLIEIIAALRDAGIAYHNPYRITRGDWNPLARGTKKTTATDRLLIYLKQNYGLNQPDGVAAWTNSDVRKWLEWVRVSEFFTRGFKTQIESTAEFEPDELFDQTLFDAWLRNPLENFWPIVDANLDWYVGAIAADRKKQLAFPIKIIESRGIKALSETPRVIVSTIHAAKGGESDIVYLFPDLSPQAHNEWMKGGTGREGVRRTFYVGMTRPREELICCPPASNMSVKF